MLTSLILLSVLSTSAPPTQWGVQLSPPEVTADGVLFPVEVTATSSSATGGRCVVSPESLTPIQCFSAKGAPYTDPRKMAEFVASLGPAPVYQIGVGGVPISQPTSTVSTVHLDAATLGKFLRTTVDLPRGGGWQVTPEAMEFAPIDRGGAASWGGMPAPAEVSAEITRAWRCAAWESLRLEPAATGAAEVAWGLAATAQCPPDPAQAAVTLPHQDIPWKRPIDPTFPDEGFAVAKLAGGAGLVCVARMEVDKLGTVKAVRVVGCPRVFREALSKALLQSTVVPHEEGGIRVGFVSSLPLRFKIAE